MRAVKINAHVYKEETIMSLEWKNKATLKKLENKWRVYSVCRQNMSVKTGDVFRGIRFAEKPYWPKIDFSKQKVCIHGIAYEDELLVSTRKQRYFFTLKDGWGMKDGYLYGMRLGTFMDFGRSVTREEIQEMADSPSKKRGVYTHMSEAMKKEQMKTILKVMNNIDKGEHLCQTRKK